MKLLIIIKTRSKPDKLKIHSFSYSLPKTTFTKKKKVKFGAKINTTNFLKKKKEDDTGADEATEAPPP